MVCANTDLRLHSRSLIIDHPVDLFSAAEDEELQLWEYVEKMLMLIGDGGGGGVSCTDGFYSYISAEITQIEEMWERKKKHRMLKINI